MTSDRLCIVCVRQGRVELHHLAGRACQPWLVAPVCVPCHRFLHARLAAAGINLKTLTPTPSARSWAVLRGTSDTIATAFSVCGEPVPAATLAGWAHDIGRLLVGIEPGIVTPRPAIALGITRLPSRRLTTTQRGHQASLLVELSEQARHALDEEGRG
jgi:hypothetical protein